MPAVKRGASKNYVPTPEEYERLLDAARDPLDKVVLNTLGETGLRSREFLSIRRYWFDDGKLIIPDFDPKTGFRAKTMRAARTIPIRGMNEKSWMILRNWFEEHEKIGVTPVTLWNRVRKAGLRAELGRKLFPHALRARCATVWAYRLNNERVLQDIFGWESSKVAERYIAHAGGRSERAVRDWRMRNDGMFSTLNSIPPPEYMNQQPWFTILNNVKSQFTILNS